MSTASIKLDEERDRALREIRIKGGLVGLARAIMYLAEVQRIGKA